jgi:hypothetical protein
LLKDGEGYYCIKCSYTGTEAEVRAVYAQLQKKYRLLTTRVTLDELR